MTNDEWLIEEIYKERENALVEANNAKWIKAIKMIKAQIKNNKDELKRYMGKRKKEALYVGMDELSKQMILLNYFEKIVDECTKELM